MQSLIEYPVRIVIIALTFLAVLGLALLNINTSQMQPYNDYVQAQVINSNGLTGAVLVDAQKMAKTAFRNSGTYKIINPKTNQPFPWYVDETGQPIQDAVTKANEALVTAGYGQVRYGTRVTFTVTATYPIPIISYITRSSSKSITFDRKVSAVVNSYAKEP